MAKIFRIAASVFVVLFTTAGVLSIAGATGVTQIDDAAATFTVEGSPPTGTPPSCTGIGGMSDLYFRQAGVVHGTSQDTGAPGRFSLTGNVTISALEMVHVTGDGWSSGSYLLTYPTDSKHRLKGTFKAVLGNVDVLGQTADGRGFISAAYQRKTSTGWVPTGDMLLASTEFSVAPDSGNGGAPQITGTIGGVASNNNFSVKAIGHC